MTDAHNPLQDLSLLQLFQMEAKERCQDLSETLVRLEQDQAQGNDLEALMRSAHSLKGAARIVNLHEVVQIAHGMEDVFSAAMKNRLVLTNDAIDVLLQAVDYLQRYSNQDNLERLSGDTKLSPDGKKMLAAIPPLLRQQRPLAPTPKEVDPKEKPAAAASSAVDAGVTLSIGSESLDRLLGLANEVQSATRYLPTFNDRLLVLKRQQNALARELEQSREAIVLADQQSRRMAFSALEQRIDDCRQTLSAIQDAMAAQSIRATDLAHRLHREVLSSKMVPFATGTKGLGRFVRDQARKLQKKIRLEIIGGKTLVDRDVLQEMEAPLRHLIRNCLDHGIERPQVRKEAGKEITGTITVKAYHHAGHLHLEVGDDGRGIDMEQIRQMVVAKGLADEPLSVSFSDQELYAFLFLPSFTTTTEVTELSGRGVGLDVVNDSVRRLGGTITVTSGLNRGTRFTMQLPLTLSVIRALLVAINDELFALPAAQVVSVHKVAATAILQHDGTPCCKVNDQMVRLVDGRALLEAGSLSSGAASVQFIVLQDHSRRFGLVVDSLQGIQDLIVQPLDPRLGKVEYIDAGAILEDGRPVLIFDKDDLLLAMAAALSGKTPAASVPAPGRPGTAAGKVVLVVDDSITVREVEREMLLTHGYQVEVAVNGEEAWKRIQQGGISLVISDIDMPKMDGFTLTTKIKNHPELFVLPIIIVSYKDRDEDRIRGLQAGADCYLTKSGFDDARLLDAVNTLIGTPES